MKVLGLNGSPRLKRSATYHIMEHFLAGMEAAGAETTVLHLQKLDIKPCLGCYHCWVRTPGVCTQKDDMANALAQYNSADVIVFGTPLYHFTMTGTMKNFIDRTLPRFEPWLVSSNDDTHLTGHPRRYEKPTGMFLISACGFPEPSNFDALVATFKKMRMPYLGQILRTGAEVMSLPEMQGFFTDYYAIVKQAGEQFARQVEIAEQLQERLQQDFFPGGKEGFIEGANAYWEMLMDSNKVPAEMRHSYRETGTENKGGSGEAMSAAGPNADGVNGRPPGRDEDATPSSASARELLMNMPKGFDSAAAGALAADIQFIMQGDEPGEYYLRIAAGKCSFHEGRAATPSLTIETPSQVWLAISRGELDGQQAFMQQRYRASGDFALLMRLAQLFRRER